MNIYLVFFNSGRSNNFIAAYETRESALEATKIKALADFSLDYGGFNAKFGIVEGSNSTYCYNKRTGDAVWTYFVQKVALLK